MNNAGDPNGSRVAGPVDPRLLRYAPAARRFIGFSALFAFAQTVLTVAAAWLLTTAIVAAIATEPIAATLAWLLAVTAGRGVLNWTSEALGIRAAAQTGSELRARLMGAVARLGSAWLVERNQAGVAVSAGHGLDALDPYFSRYIPQLVLTVFATPTLLAVMWWHDWISALIAGLTLPLVPLFLALIGLATRSVQRRQFDTLQQLATRFTDTVQGLATLRLFGREHRAVVQVEATAEAYRHETMRVLRFSFLSGFALELLSSLAVALIAVATGLRLLSGELDLATGLFVLLLAPEAFLPMRQVGVQFHAAAEGVAATEGILAVLSDAQSMSVRRSRAQLPVRTQQAIVQQPCDAELTPPPRIEGGELRACQLRVIRDNSALAAVSFVATAGTVTLLEGASGSGKSSVFAALRGAAKFAGSAAIDGMDVRELSPAAWLAWAGQQPDLLSGTIAENVALGAQQPDASLIRAALDAAGAPELDPERTISVQATGVSGGQAQRVTVARAIYRWRSGAACVLALDEPTSALDPVTEHALWRGVRCCADDGATVLLISHRRSARAIADRVLQIGASA